MNEEIIMGLLEEIKNSADSINTNTGWVERNGSDTLEKLDEIIKILKKIERKF